MDGLQQGTTVQVEIKVRGHSGRKGSLPPLVLRQVDSPYQGIRDLVAKEISRSAGAANVMTPPKAQRPKWVSRGCPSGGTTKGIFLQQKVGKMHTKLLSQDALLILLPQYFTAQYDWTSMLLERAICQQETAKSALTVRKGPSQGTHQDGILQSLGFIWILNRHGCAPPVLPEFHFPECPSAFQSFPPHL